MADENKQETAKRQSQAEYVTVMPNPELPLTDRVVVKDVVVEDGTRLTKTQYNDISKAKNADGVVYVVKKEGGE